MLTCRKCGDTLSRQEEIDYNRQREEGCMCHESSPICSDCWEMEQADYQGDEPYSDADHGL